MSSMPVEVAAEQPSLKVCPAFANVKVGVEVPTVNVKLRNSH